MATIKDAELGRFLDLIAFSEGTSKASNSATSKITQNDGYDAIVAGVDGPSIFSNYAYHPFSPAAGRKSVEVIAPCVRDPEGLYSTAAGRYQVRWPIFEVYEVTLALDDFGPASQDAVALQLIDECHAIALIKDGKIEDAISACSSRWASFPGSNAGQGGRSMSQLLLEWSAL